MVKIILRIGINTLIGAVLIYFWFKLVDVNEVLVTLKSFNPLNLIPAALFMFLSIASKAFRFKVLLKKEADVPVLKMLNLTFLSQLLSFLIPIRAGEAAKAVYLSTEFKLHFGKAIVWVFLDRFLDFWAVLGLSLILFQIVPTNLPANVSLNLFLGVVLASVLVILIIVKPGFFKQAAKLISLVLIIKTLKAKFLSFSFFIIECFSLLRGNLSRNLLLLVLTILGSIFEALTWLTILSVFIPKVDFIKIWLGSMLNSLTFLIPAAPGYVGSAEAAGLAVFSYGLGFDKTVVSAATVVVHALNLVLILTVGIIGFYSLKFNLGLVWKKLRNK